MSQNFITTSRLYPALHNTFHHGGPRRALSQASFALTSNASALLGLTGIGIALAAGADPEV